LFGHRTKSNSQKINANRTKSNVRQSPMTFDLVWSPNDTYSCKRAAYVISHDMIWIERMFGFPSFCYHGDKYPGKCVNRSSHLKLCFLYFHTYFSFRPDIHSVCQHFPGNCYPDFYHGNEFHEFCKLTVATWIKFSRILPFPMVRF